MRIAQTLDTLVAYVRNQGYSWEVVVADDGSQDRTAAMVKATAREYPEIRLVSLEHRGKGWAVKAGMLEAQGKYRFLADADLSMPIEQMERFLPSRLTDFDIAIGSREAPSARRFHEPARRHLMGRAFNGMVQLLAVRGFTDTQCGFKCFEAQVAESLFPLQRAEGFGFDVEILFLAQRLGLRIKEVPIDWYYHEGSKVKPLRDSFLMLKDLLSVRWNSLRGRYDTLSRKAIRPQQHVSEGDEAAGTPYKPE
ncbi:glycosyltransferase family 2 protein [SAR202 cluster bacterium AC-647-N09_OGT_505m]|nr:glycosyltransferase family 2 protein [SAR202 cluster bacterium AC-647-N09_OGT_505m]